MIQLPDSESTGIVADWIELTLALEGGTLSKSDISTLIERNSGIEIPEGFLTSIWRELEYRNELFSQPFFTIGERTIESVIVPPAPNEYLMCLLLSIYGVPNQASNTGKLFERLSRIAIEKYLNGRAIVFGWPFDNPQNEDEQTVLERQVRNLAETINERFCEAPLSHFKDRGLDVVGWIPHDDDRSCQLVILVQCGAGHNWVDKNAVSLRAWNQYIHWANDPLVAFAVPCVIKERDWHDHSRDKGLLFDRIRLVNLIRGNIVDNDLNGALTNWVQNKIAEYAG
jgi:hypothetical protein